LKSRLDRLEKLILEKSDTKATVNVSSAKIDQNAPNPFNGSTFIRYDIPANANSAAVSTI